MRNYQYLVAVATRGHFGEAAQECCVTQPTLSLGIKELERQLGFALIYRERRYLGLTGEGEIVVEYARRMLGLRDSLHATLEQYRLQQDAPLVFGTVPSGVDMVAHFATRLSQLNMSRSFVTETVSKGSVAAAVLSGELDLGITHLDKRSDDLYVLANLHEDQPYLMAPQGMQLDGPTVKILDIQGLPVCHLLHEYYGPDVQKNLANAAVGPRIFAGSVRVLVSQLEQRYWYGVVPRGVVDTINRYGTFWARPIETQGRAPRLAIVSRPISAYRGTKQEIVEYLRKTAWHCVDKGLQHPCTHSSATENRAPRISKQNPVSPDLIETIN